MGFVGVAFGIMSEVLWLDGHKIDRASQKMLRELRGGEWTYGSTLREAADLAENTQVFYRMENYLEPSGLVLEAARVEDEARQFQLTEAGEEWVKQNAGTVLGPETRDEVASMAAEAYEAGMSAKESVQNYRKKVNRVKNRLDETREDVRDLEDQEENQEATLDMVWQRSEDNRDRSKESRERIQALESDIETRAEAERVSSIEESASKVEERLRLVEERQMGLARQQAERERERAEIVSLAKAGGYVAGGAAGAYVVLVGATYLIAPGLAVSAVVAGIAVVLGMAVAIGGLLYVRGRRSLTTVSDEGETRTSLQQ